MNMIFNKTMQAVKDFDSIMNAAKEIYRNTKTEILATYTEAVSTEKLREAQEILVNAETEAKQTARKAVQEDFEAIRSQVNEYVTAAVPSDFTASMAAVEALGNDVTDAEAEAFINKYKGNYAAFRSLLKVLHGAGKATGIMAITVDVIRGQMEESERIILNWIQTYKGGDYMSALLTNDEHTPIKALDENVQAFLNGEYVL